MGGDHRAASPLTFSHDQYSPVNQDVEHLGKYGDERVNEEYGLAFGEFEEMGSGVISSTSLEVEVDQKKRYKAFKEVLQSYGQLRSRVESLNEAKGKILSYTPGGWMEKLGSMKPGDYNVPNTTTLLLVGPRGSGKSSLVNRITKVFDNDKFSPERAQVSHNYSAGDGTYFLQEYTIPRSSTSFCLYDTRSLSDDSYDNIEMLKHWMTKGVRHGELTIRPCDNSCLRTKIKCKARNSGNQSKERRAVNFVMFVVNGLTVLKSMSSKVEEGNQYINMIASTFNSPYLSFKDDKPVVVVTHGDLLSLSDRAHICVKLGELLGIPPAKQIFDVPESSDPVTELTIIDMLRYSLEHADNNFPRKETVTEKVQRIKGFVSANIHLFIILGIAIISISIQQRHMRRKPQPEDWHIDWHSIRHLWLE